MKTPDKNSQRSKRRANRGFSSLEQSSRKHRRMLNRLGISRVVIVNTHAAHKGGSVNFH